MENKDFDLIVIGSGPGGYVAAIGAAQRGKKVGLVEAKELGGTCLNRGCIPSKALIAGAEVLHTLKKASQFGIEVTDIYFDYAKMVKRKDDVVKNIRRGLTGLIAANKIVVIKGYARFSSPSEINVTGDDAGVYKAKKIIIATGSEPRNIGAFPFDGKKIHDSTSLLEMTTLPKSLVIIGGGVIGCEFASLFEILGVKITVIEMMSSLLPMEETTCSTFLTRSFISRGIDVITGKAVEGIDTTDSGVKVRLAEGQTVEAEIALVAVGRQMNTTDIGLDKAGVKTDGKGNIIVNDKMETNVANIYAIGDISSKWWLAHVASHQGLVAARNACGEEARMHYDAVPSVTFTHPEIATCGLSLAQAKEKGFDAAIGSFPFIALGKAQAAMETEGFAQIVIDKKTGQILGAQVAHAQASSLIGEMGVAIANELTVECITETIHAHPTLPEAWGEAALVAIGMPLHLPPKK